MPARRPTAVETEIKLPVADLAELIGQLVRLGARCRGRVLERNTLFDTPESDLRRRRRLLRVRIETPAPSELAPGGRRRVIVTSKAPLATSAPAGYKHKLEREVVARPATDWPAALRSVGFFPGFRYEKFRTTFRLRGLHLDLDETPVGTFLEIEGRPAAIDRIARALGYSRRDYIRATYWDLNAAEYRRVGRIPRNMLFRA
jgi:adenylate cyclase, class 2